MTALRDRSQGPLSGTALRNQEFAARSGKAVPERHGHKGLGGGGVHGGGQAPQVIRQGRGIGRAGGPQRVADQRFHKASVSSGEARLIGLQPAIETAGQLLHALRHGEIANARLAQGGVQILEEAVDEFLRQGFIGLVAPQPQQQHRRVRHDQLQPPFERIGQPVRPEKARSAA